MQQRPIFQLRLEQSLSREVAEALLAVGYQLAGAKPGERWERLLVKADAAVVIVDDIARLLELQVRGSTNLFTIALSTKESESCAVAALRSGALDYFRWPEERDAFLSRVSRLMPETVGPAAACSLVGNSTSMQLVRQQIARAAATDANVLILGETGTGKELAAQLLHQLSRRSARPFVAVNCAAIPDTLLESELFGHDRGAFTGATETAEGKLRQADKGTLFLDEVGDMSPLAQAKILRVFESRTVVRVGGRTPLPVDVRFVAATNADLTMRAEQGQFRPDLFYRLNVAEVNIPPLRERPSDIALLVDHYVRDCNQRLHRNGQEFTRDVMHGFERYAWPGNVRQLRNTIEATFVNSSARWLSWTDLPLQFRRYFPPQLERRSRGERELLIEALSASRGNKTQAAARLHCSRMSLYRKLAKFGLPRD
jgi:DNA-binding NtrC family response regulator